MIMIFLKSDEDKANFGKLIEVMKQSKKGKTLGMFLKENYPGAFMDAWRAALKNESFDTVSTRCFLDKKIIHKYISKNHKILSLFLLCINLD